MNKECTEVIKDLKNFILEEKRKGRTVVSRSTSCNPVKKKIIAEKSTVTKAEKLQNLYEEYANCLQCALGKTKTKFVFGEGNPEARLMFIGEGPGFDEDQQGRPFIGKAGQLLTKAFETTIGLKREEVYIANIVKCHPMVDPANPLKRGNDRPPTAEETAACIPILYRQIEIIQPELICFLGNSAAQTMLKTNERISQLRGKFHSLTVDGKKISSIATLHPAACLYHQDNKRFVWEDFKKIKEFLAPQQI